MFKKSYWAIIILGCLLAMIMTACNGSDDGDYVSPIPHTAVDMTPTNELLLYLPEWYRVDFHRALDIYKKTYPDVNVKIEYIEWDDVNGAETYVQRVNTELMADTGPDVIMASSDLFNDLYKTMDTAAFLNLATIIENDEFFQMEDYYQAIFDAGLYKGGRYLAPLSFDIELLTYLPSELEEYGFDLSKSFNTISFFEELAASLPKLRENPHFEFAISRFPFLDLVFSYAGIQLVDYETMEILPDEELLRAFCEAYKPYWKIDYQHGRGAWGDAGMHDGSGRILFGWVYSSPYQRAAVRATSTTGDYSVEMMMIPSADNSVNAIMQNALAIRANSPNHLNAWNFIKVMLSEQVQIGDYSGVFHGRLPVNREAMRKVIDYMARRGITMMSGAGIKYNFQLTEEEAEQTVDMFDSISGCIIHNDIIQAYFLDYMNPYFNDEKTLDECLDELRNWMVLYVSE